MPASTHTIPVREVHESAFESYERIEKYGVWARLNAHEGEVYLEVHEIEGPKQPSVTSDQWVTVEEPASQDFLNRVNRAFGTSYTMEDWGMDPNYGADISTSK